jgi:hypothetical protein
MTSITEPFRAVLEFAIEALLIISPEWVHGALAASTSPDIKDATRFGARC